MSPRKAHSSGPPALVLGFSSCSQAQSIRRLVFDARSAGFQDYSVFLNEFLSESSNVLIPNRRRECSTMSGRLSHPKITLLSRRSDRCCHPPPVRQHYTTSFPPSLGLYISTPLPSPFSPPHDAFFKPLVKKLSSDTSTISFMDPSTPTCSTRSTIPYNPLLTIPTLLAMLLTVVSANSWTR